MEKTFRKLSALGGKRIILAAVGLADPNNPENITTIKNAMEKQLPREAFANAQVLHFRGGIDYSRLRFLQKNMMAMMYKKVSGLPEEKRQPKSTP